MPTLPDPLKFGHNRSTVAAILGGHPRAEV